MQPTTRKSSPRKLIFKVLLENMSFGYGVGDVIAVLGHCERVAIELRNYKDTPMQFQQLRAPSLISCGIRAIVIYCAQPLQSMADKMRTKETTDVQELRQTVVSQMAAINVLLILQQQLASQ
ncbi:Uncharacterized protein HZ326_6634 [Fusarium oxysporum f. sp. albedinis]|nr:Uncharacterized protein HZ326_6634 [Fusarium oxysporum f. sp. albedinis]